MRRRLAIVRWVMALVNLTILVAIAVWALTITGLSAADVRRWENVGAWCGVSLWLAAFIPIGLAVYDLIYLRGAVSQGARVTSDDWALVWRDLEQAVYRWIGKSLLVLAVMLLWLSPHPGVLHWLRQHPLSFFLLIFGAMAVFTVVDLAEVPFRTAFRGRGPAE